MNEQELNTRFEIIEKRLDKLESVNPKTEEVQPTSGQYQFNDKKKEHADLLEELLKSDSCHSKNGLSIEEIMNVFRQNGRPVVRKKISDLLHVWVKRKRIESIKTKGDKRHKYFWIE